MRLALLVIATSSTIASAGPTGNVLVPEDAELHATKEAALADSRPPRTGKPIAMRLVREHGDVVELQTGDVVDCADTRETPYKLTVFVHRLRLYGRIKTPVKQTFSDGTALVLDRGAPSHGLEWAKRPAAPSNITIAVPGALGKAELPRAGTQLVCDGGPPVTLDEWMAKQRRRTTRKPAPKSQDDASKLADLITSDSYPMPPSCSVRDNILPTVDGKTVVWPTQHVFPAGVVKVGKDFFADVHLWCGRARMRIDEASIGDDGGGGGGSALGGLGGGGKRIVWIPKAGKVTWPDGKPAGTYRGDEQYDDVDELDDRICVAVPNVAERVCHPKKTTKKRD